MTTEIYVNRNGEELGPFSSREIQACLKSGELSPADGYWYEGQVAWTELSEFDATRVAAASVSRRKIRAKLADANIVVGVVLAVVALVISAFVFSRDEATSAESSGDPNGSKEGSTMGGIAPERKAEVLAAMYDAGHPTNLAQLNDWYEPVPDQENASLLFAQDLEALPRFSAKSDRLPIYLRENADRIPRLLEFSRMEKCRFPVDFNDGSRTLLSHVPVMKSVTQLLAWEAERQARLRKPERSVELLIGALQAQNALRNEPAMISCLVATLAREIAWKSLQEMIGRLALEDALLVDLQSALSEADRTESTLRALVGEKLMTIDFFFAGGEAQRAQIAEWTKHGMRPIPLKYRFQATYRKDFDLLIESLDRRIASIRRDNYPAMLKAASEAQGRLASLSPNAGAYSTQGRFIEKQATWEARRRTALAVLAIERYRAANKNQLPNDLQDLVPAFIEAVPKDPFDGNPIRYGRLSRGYVVYSVGKDRQDNQGKETRERDDPGDLPFVVRRR
jgi:hypothetical protein